MCQGSKALSKSGLFLVGGRDLITFLPFPVFSSDDAVSSTVFIVISIRKKYNKLIKLIIFWITLFKTMIR